MNQPTSQGHVSFLGGLNRRFLGLSLGVPWPSVRVDLTDDGLRIGPSSALFSALALGLTPTWHFSWSDIAHAERVGRFPYSGVRFYVRGRAHPFLITCWKPAKLLHALDRKGVEVDWQIRRPSIVGV